MMGIQIYAKKGDILKVGQEIASGVDIDCIDKYSSQTPLMCAVTSPDAGIDMLRFLVENGANVNALSNEDHNTVLGLAVQSGNIDKIQFLLDAGADINYQTPCGYDVLIDAMYGRDISQDKNLLSILNLLISKGASVSGISSYGESAVRVASSVGRFDAVRVLLAAGADSNQLEWTELMHAIALGTVEDVKVLVDKKSDMEVRDSCNRTPWLLSLQVGELSKSKLLLSSGASRSDCGDGGKSPLIFAIESNHIEMLEWLIAQGFDIELIDEFDTTPLMVAVERGMTNCVKILLEAGANASKVDTYNSKAISKASNIEIFRMLFEAGEDINDINDDMRRLLTGVNNREIQVSAEEYAVGKHPRFGKTNPEIMEIAFWKAMVYSGDSAYKAKSIFGDTENDNWNQLVWCYQRFGETITQLPDGRIVEIGGEHEDSYDPDFCIYNDVVVYQGDGNFQIFGYPWDIFPPTDFHSATLVGEYIYIIGNLGYYNERISGETPVYRLHCDTLKIEKVETTGENPGWISEHKAFYKEPNEIQITGGKVFVIIDDKKEYLDNLFDYALNLTNFDWIRVHTVE